MCIKLWLHTTQTPIVKLNILCVSTLPTDFQVLILVSGKHDGHLSGKSTTREYRLKDERRRFNMDMRRMSFTQWVVGKRNKLPEEEIEVGSMFKKTF